MPEPPSFTLLRCTGCGSLDAPPRSYCRTCGGAKLEVTPAGGTGTLVTWTVIRKPPAAFAGQPLYAVAVVDLAEGVRVTGRLERVESSPALGAGVRIAQVLDGVPVFVEQCP